MKIELKSCNWMVFADGLWLSECGLAWEFTTGTPHGNYFRHRPFCGLKLHERGTTEEA